MAGALIPREDDMLQVMRNSGAALALVVLAAFFAAGTASAHHGWRWAEEKNSEITGVVTKAVLGNPHGILTLDVAGESWIVEVGQPWRNERAGLTDAMLQPGVKLTAQGHRSADPNDKRLKAERIVIDGKTYNLYPDRD